MEEEDPDRAARLDRVVDDAVLLAATLDVLQQRITGGPLTTNLGLRIEQVKREWTP